MGSNQQKTPEVFYMTLGELDLELELVRKADYDSLIEQLEASRNLNLRMWNFLADVVEDEWGAKPPYTGDFEEMNVYLGLLGPSNPASSLPSDEEVRYFQRLHELPSSLDSSIDTEGAEAGWTGAPAPASEPHPSPRCWCDECVNRTPEFWEAQSPASGRPMSREMAEYFDGTEAQARAYERLREHDASNQDRIQEGE